MSKHKEPSSALGVAPRSALRLTPREADVYRLMADGLKPCEITRRLKINKRNARRYRMRVAAKLRSAYVALSSPNVQSEPRDT